MRTSPLSYDEYRTGLTYADVALMLRVESWRKFESTGERMFITRHTILGRWHEIKRTSYSAYRRYFHDDSNSGRNPMREHEDFSTV